LQNLAPNEIPSIESVVQLSLVFALKGVRDLLLIYPINVLLLLGTLLYFAYRMVRLVTKPRIFVQWPNQHVEQHDLHIKNFKKDVREIQDESFGLSRRMEARKKDAKKEEGEGTAAEASPTSEDLTKLLKEREYIKEVSDEFINEIKTSEARILEKIRKYQR
jgi:hypothetical protein